MALFGSSPSPTPAPASVQRPDPNAIARLSQLEQVVAAGLAAFHRAGLALAEIRDKKLYSHKWSSFESYLESRWSISREHGHRLIQAAEVCANLKGLEPLPQNEAQARVLAKLEPEQQRQVWTDAKQALPNGNVTAEALEEIADKVVPNRKKSRRKKPKDLVLKGKGWSIRLTRKTAELDPAGILAEAMAQLQAKTAAPKAA